MEDNRLIEIEEDQQQRQDHDDGQGLISEGITSPRDSSFISNVGEEDDEEEDEDYDDDEDYEDEYEEEDDDFEDEDEDEDEEVEELIPVVTTSPIVSSSIVDGTVLEAAMDDSNELESCKNQENGGGNGGKKELNRGEIDGLFCPICLDSWTSGGDHQICCLPCGHIYGSSCIKKWLQLRRGSGKCPQCNSLCRLKDVRVLYASRLCVADEELHKRVRSLEAKCAYLEQKEIRPSDVSYTKHMIDERFAYFERELQSLREEQIQIKQVQQELQVRIDQHITYVRSMEEMRRRQPHTSP